MVFISLATVCSIIEAFITAKTTIYNAVEPEEEEAIAVNSSRFDYYTVLSMLLKTLFDCDCLSAKGCVLKAWLDVNGGAPLVSGSEEVMTITRIIGHAQPNHVSIHLKELSQMPSLSRHFHYTVCRKHHARTYTQRIYINILITRGCYMNTSKRIKKEKVINILIQAGLKPIRPAVPSLTIYELLVIACNYLDPDNPERFTIAGTEYALEFKPNRYHQ